jgi:hypothetical protein
VRHTKQLPSHGWRGTPQGWDNLGVTAVAQTRYRPEPLTRVPLASSSVGRHSHDLDLKTPGAKDQEIDCSPVMQAERGDEPVQAQGQR